MPEQWTQESVEQEAQKLEEQQTQEPQQEQPQQQAEPAQEEAEKVKEERVVPLAAVQEERARRREAIQRAQALEAQVQQLQRSHLELMQRLSQPPAQQRDPNDVAGQLHDGIQRTQQEIQQLRQAQQANQMLEVQREQNARFQASVVSDEQEFAKEHPDYFEAAKFARDARMKEYQAMGLSRAAAEQRVNMDVVQLCDWAFQNGERPSKAAYDWAKARGFVSGKQKLAMQRDGQQASMPQGGNGQGGGAPSLEQLLKMDSKDFAKATSGDNWAKLLKRYS